LFLLIGRVPNDFDRAKQLEMSDPSRAAELWANIVRRDGKSSQNGVDGLTRIWQPCSLQAMVDLLDLADGSKTALFNRRRLWKEVSRRLAATGSDFPQYDTEASLAIRVEQQNEIRAWMRAHSEPGGSAAGSPVALPAH
jgi:hypothetical protein